MEQLLEQAKQLNESLQAVIADNKAKTLDLEADIARVQQQIASNEERAKDLSAREQIISGIEYSAEIIAKNESLLKSNQQAKEELDNLIQDLGRQKKAFIDEKNAALAEIETERELQKRNSVAIQDRDKELKAKIAEFDAKLQALKA